MSHRVARSILDDRGRAAAAERRGDLPIDVDEAVTARTPDIGWRHRVAGIVAGMTRHGRGAQRI